MVGDSKIDVSQLAAYRDGSLTRSNRYVGGLNSIELKEIFDETQAMHLDFDRQGSASYENQEREDTANIAVNSRNSNYKMNAGQILRTNQDENLAVEKVLRTSRSLHHSLGNLSRRHIQLTAVYRKLQIDVSGLQSTSNQRTS